VSRPPAGLPENLPQGERLLWQGAPDWRTLATRAFHLRGWAIYFAVLIVWYIVSTLLSGTPPLETAVATSRFVGLALVPLLLIVVYAWAVSRATTYTITDRRVVIRLGLALPMTINLPFNRIDNASFHADADGSGNIALELAPGNKLAWFVLWPHARPWHMAKAQPMLRALPQVQGVAQMLARALATSASLPVAVIPQLQDQQHPAKLLTNRPHAAASA
jgi:hypothetical protein